MMLIIIRSAVATVTLTGAVVLAACGGSDD
jgi:hypothetical protein